MIVDAAGKLKMTLSGAVKVSYFAPTVHVGRVHNIFPSFSSGCTAYTPGVPTGSLQSLDAVYGLLACMVARVAPQHH